MPRLHSFLSKHSPNHLHQPFFLPCSVIAFVPARRAVKGAKRVLSAYERSQGAGAVEGRRDRSKAGWEADLWQTKSSILQGMPSRYG